MTGISLESLTEGIKKCDANILIFEEAIKKERTTQEDYRNMAKGANSDEKSMFTEEALEAGIKKCDANIVIFETAIKKERVTQEDFRNMITEANRMEKKRDMVENGVNIEVEVEEETEVK